MRYLIVILLGSLFIFGCTDKGSDQSQVVSDQLKVYRHSMNGNPSSLDPAQASDVYSNFAVLNIFDTLYSYKYLERPYRIKPNLAQSLPEISDNGLIYKIKIKQGVYFHPHTAFKNGEQREVVAEDFVYSIKRMFDPEIKSSGSWLWQHRIQGLDQWKANGSDYKKKIDGLYAEDKYTIVIKLIKPYPQLLYTLATGYSALVPEEVADYLGVSFGLTPIGSGPFKLDSFNQELVVLSKNPDFRQEPINLQDEGYKESIHGAIDIQTLQGKSPPFLDRLEIHFISNSEQQWQSFNKKENIQFISIPQELQNKVILEKEPLMLHPQITDAYHQSIGMEAGFVYAGFNMLDPQFGSNGDPEHDAKSQALRCAIRNAHDWQLKNQKFYFGLGSVFPGVIPPMVPEYSAEISTESIEKNLDKASALLSDAGWNEENLPVFEYHTSGGVVERLQFEQMRSFLKLVGYPQNKIEYHPYASFGRFNQAIKNKKAVFFYLAWTLDYPDAENTLQLFYGPNAAAGSNITNYNNPEYDKLFELSQSMQPSDERTQLYQQMNQIIIDDCVTISGLSRNRIHLWHKDVIMYPDRDILGGFFLRYVDIR